MTIRNLAIAPLLATALLLSACSGSEAPAEHAEAAGHEAPTSSSAGLPDGNIAAGEKLAATKGAATGQSCVDCHGVEGYKNAYPNFHVPKIGGQSAQYLQNALTAYQQGSRKHPTMQAQAESFSEQDIADIAAFLSNPQ